MARKKHLTQQSYTNELLKQKREGMRSALPAATTYPPQGPMGFAEGGSPGHPEPLEAPDSWRNHANPAIEWGVDHVARGAAHANQVARGEQPKTDLPFAFADTVAGVGATTAGAMYHLGKTAARKLTGLRDGGSPKKRYYLPKHGQPVELHDEDGLRDGGSVSKNVLPLRNGGPVTGKGGPTEDKQLALVSPKEYVLPADTVAAVGRHNLDALRDRTHKFVHKSHRTGLRHLADGSQNNYYAGVQGGSSGYVSSQASTPSTPAAPASYGGTSQTLSITPASTADHYNYARGLAAQTPATPIMPENPNMPKATTYSDIQRSGNSFTQAAKPYSGPANTTTVAGWNQMVDQIPLGKETPNTGGLAGGGGFSGGYPLMGNFLNNERRGVNNPQTLRTTSVHRAQMDMPPSPAKPPATPPLGTPTPELKRLQMSQGKDTSVPPVIYNADEPGVDPAFQFRRPYFNTQQMTHTTQPLGFADGGSPSPQRPVYDQTIRSKQTPGRGLDGSLTPVDNNAESEGLFMRDHPTIATMGPKRGMPALDLLRAGTDRTLGNEARLPLTGLADGGSPRGLRSMSRDLPRFADSNSPYNPWGKVLNPSTNAPFTNEEVAALRATGTPAPSVSGSAQGSFDFYEPQPTQVARGGSLANRPLPLSMDAIRGAETQAAESFTQPRGQVSPGQTALDLQPRVESPRPSGLGEAMARARPQPMVADPVGAALNQMRLQNQTWRSPSALNPALRVPDMEMLKGYVAKAQPFAAKWGRRAGYVGTAIDAAQTGYDVLTNPFDDEGLFNSTNTARVGQFLGDFGGAGAGAIAGAPGGPIGMFLGGLGGLAVSRGLQNLGGLAATGKPMTAQDIIAGNRNINARYAEAMRPQSIEELNAGRVKRGLPPIPDPNAKSAADQVPPDKPQEAQDIDASRLQHAQQQQQGAPFPNESARSLAGLRAMMAINPNDTFAEQSQANQMAQSEQFARQQRNWATRDANENMKEALRWDRSNPRYAAGLRAMAAMKMQEAQGAEGSRVADVATNMAGAKMNRDVRATREALLANLGNAQYNQELGLRGHMYTADMNRMGTMAQLLRDEYWKRIAQQDKNTEGLQKMLDTTFSTPVVDPKTGAITGNTPNIAQQQLFRRFVTSKLGKDASTLTPAEVDPLIQEYKMRMMVPKAAGASAERGLPTGVFPGGLPEFWRDVVPNSPGNPIDNSQVGLRDWAAQWNPMLSPLQRRVYHVTTDIGKPMTVTGAQLLQDDTTAQEVVRMLRARGDHKTANEIDMLRNAGQHTR